MTKRRKPDNDVGSELLETAPARRRGKRRLIWPLLLASALAIASWTIAQAATLPPLALADAAAHGLVTHAARAPIAAVMPTASPLASAKPAPFGPQIEVILPPPPPAAPGGGSGSSGLRKAVTATMSYTAFCAGGVSATASAGSVPDLLNAVNAERARIGSAPLAWSSALASDAADWSSTMATNQSNNFDLATQAGRDAVGTQPWYDAVFHHSGHGAENIAFAYGRGTSPAGVHVKWMASEGHCKNIMNPGYTQFGAGDAWSSDSGYFATERFS